MKEFKFNIGDTVFLKENFYELWSQHKRPLPLAEVMQYFYNNLVGVPLKIQDRTNWDGINTYNVEGFSVEEYLLERMKG